MEEIVGTGTITARVTAGLVTPDKEAVMLVAPAATPLASPEEEMVAALVSELVHVAWEVMSAVEPSE
jgi:hypothetical protein